MLEVARQRCPGLRLPAVESSELDVSAARLGLEGAQLVNGTGLDRVQSHSVIRYGRDDRTRATVAMISTTAAPGQRHPVRLRGTASPTRRAPAARGARRGTPRSCPRP